MLIILTSVNDINILGQDFQIKNLIITAGVVALLFLVIIISIFIILKTQIKNNNVSSFNNKMFKMESVIIDTEEEIGKMRQLS